MYPNPPTNPPRRSRVTPGRAAQARTEVGMEWIVRSLPGNHPDGKLVPPWPQLGAPGTGPPWVSCGHTSVTQPR